MTLEQAIVAANGEDILPAPRIRLWARRTRGGTLICGVTPGFTLPDGVNDAEITLPPDCIKFHADRTKEFRGHSYMDILEEGNQIINEFNKSKESK